MLIYRNTPNSQKGGYEMPVDITWYDNAAFRVDTGKEILWFDPSVNKNTASPIRVEDINEPADFVFTTHGDPGHFVNSVEVAQRTGARFVGCKELCDHILKNGQLPAERLISLSICKTRQINGLNVYLFEALHPDLPPSLQEIVRKWGFVESPNTGIVVETRLFTLCILGDCIYSDVFEDIGRRFKIDIGMIPIQGKSHTDATPEDAAENGARIARALNVKNLFPVIQYAAEQKRIPALKQKMDAMGLKTKIFFDRPGKIHTIHTFS
jgi:L-ascorbate metabolism protein UlaG (beta-lactamase superfamily)